MLRLSNKELHAHERCLKQRQFFLDCSPHIGMRNTFVLLMSQKIAEPCRLTPRSTWIENSQIDGTRQVFYRLANCDEISFDCSLALFVGKVRRLGVG